jgi:hypothetical protein
VLYIPVNIQRFYVVGLLTVLLSRHNTVEVVVVVRRIDYGWRQGRPEYI